MKQTVLKTYDKKTESTACARCENGKRKDKKLHRNQTTDSLRLNVRGTIPQRRNRWPIVEVALVLRPELEQLLVAFITALALSELAEKFANGFRCGLRRKRRNVRAELLFLAEVERLERVLVELVGECFKTHPVVEELIQPQLAENLDNGQHFPLTLQCETAKLRNLRISQPSSDASVKS